MHCGLLVRSLEHCEGRHLPRWQAKVLQSLVATHALRLGRCFSPCGGPLPLGSPIISVTSSPTVILLASLRLLPPRTLSIIIFKIRVTTLIRRFSCKLWVSPFCPHLAEGVEKIFRVVPRARISPVKTAVACTVVSSKTDCVFFCFLGTEL